MLLASFAAAFLAMVVVLVVVWAWWQGDPNDAQRSRGVNALWAAHTWVGDRHTDAEYEDFARLLTTNEISDVFFHAGPLEGDGTVPADRIEHAGELVAAMERYASEVRVQAYLGQIERRGGGPLDLDDDDVRGHIVATASQFLDLGFDGIHYDIEPIYPGDESFLDLLDRTHDLTQRHGAVLSVAVEQLEVVPGAQRVISVFLRDYHDPTKEYLRQVAARSDQVAIMTYDTGLPAAWLFGAYMARETERVIDAIGGDVVVFMGVPTYEDGSSLRFHPRSENMRSGIRGVRKGLDGLGRERTENVGVAIFAEWTTSDDEWAAYAADWLRN
ncbi:MAG: hypothetical protein HY874_05900 [Chloroflexi bacterium]|nr:hypothetical protein [Chloroflexota bacterium]